MIVAVRPVLVLLATAALAACGGGDAPAGDASMVARVGDAVLTEADVAEALGIGGTGLDSVAARSQVVEQWVQRELLAQEARALGLDRQPAVVHRLADAERATLEAAALDHFFDQSPTHVTPEQVRTYYDAHTDALALREPYVRIRHAEVSPARAEAARQSLADLAGSPRADSLFAAFARTFSADPQGSVELARQLVPEGRLRGLDEALGERIAALAPGAVATVATPRGVHVVQVVERVPAGAVPPLGLVERDLTERLAIQHRKDAEARLLQQLRAEALSKNRLELR